MSCCSADDTTYCACLTHVPSGVIILLDRTLLLAYPPGIISYLLWQLQHMCKVMGKEAHVKAYAAREDLQAAADLHQMPRAATADKYRRLLNGKRACGLCRFLKPELISSKAEPAGTHMLRNAKKVSMGCRARVYPLACCVTAARKDA